MSRSWPQVILDHKPLFATYCRSAHATGLLIMDILADKLGVPRSEIRSRHKIEELAGDHIRFTRGPPRKTAEMPEIQTPSHTDFGTITILMNWLGGLQVWSESSRKAGPLEPDVPGEWLWVQPKPGCAIVNLGDAAVKFTNGVLCSGRHRVIPAPGEQGKWPRYSIVYFVRPTDHARLRTLKGSGIPQPGDGEEEGIEAKEWIYRQTLGLGYKKDMRND
jgi:isopenicillin N synthase-like dioxygenase